MVEENIPPVLQRAGGKGAGEGMKTHNWRTQMGTADCKVMHWVFFWVKAVGKSVVPRQEAVSLSCSPSGELTSVAELLAVVQLVLTARQS